MTDSSEKCVFLIGSESPHVESLAVANALKTLTIHRDSPTENQILELARREDVSGILATTPDVLFPTSKAAALCGLASIPLEAVRALLSRTHLLASLTNSGIKTPPYAVIHGPGEAQTRSKDVPGPWRVLSDHYGTNHLERHAIHCEDLPLAFSSVTKGLEIKAATIESELEGTGYVVCGMLQSGRFVPGAIFRHEKVRENDHVPMSLDLISEMDPTVSGRIADLCNRALETVGIEKGLWELELVASDNELYLTHIHSSMIPSAPVRTLLRAGHLEQLIAHALEWAVGIDRVTESPAPRAVAMQWLSIRSGVVRKIEGVEEAAGLEGVIEVSVGVRPGDVVGHTINRPARNALGYVIASATENRTAAKNAERARASIHIQTEAIG